MNDRRTPTEQAIADLAERLAVDTSEISIEEVEEVTWPDGSYGCPQPGMRYKQVLVNGYRIVLTVAGTTYRYHGGVGRRPFLCESPARRDRQGQRRAGPERKLEPRIERRDPPR